MGARDFPIAGIQEMELKKDSKYGKKKTKIILITAAVFAIAMVLAAAAWQVVFFIRSGKVLMAVKNTLSEKDQFASFLDLGKILDSGQYTVDVEGNWGMVWVDARFLSTPSEKQLEGAVDLTGIPKLEVNASLKEDKLRFRFPDLEDYIFAYGYREEKTGPFMEHWDKAQIDSFDSTLEMIYSPRDQGEDYGMNVLILKELKDLKFRNVKAEEFEIDGKNRKCKGYTTILAADSVSGLSDDMKISFYIYEKMLAGVRADTSKGRIQIRFLGGHTRAQKVKIDLDGHTITLQYDFTSGDFSVEDSDLKGSYASGNVASGQNGVVVTISEYSNPARNLMLDGTVAISEGAELQVLEGNEFDVGNASKAEWGKLTLGLAGRLLCLFFHINLP